MGTDSRRKTRGLRGLGVRRARPTSGVWGSAGRRCGYRLHARAPCRSLRRSGGAPAPRSFSGTRSLRTGPSGCWQTAQTSAPAHRAGCCPGRPRAPTQARKAWPVPHAPCGAAAGTLSPSGFPRRITEHMGPRLPRSRHSTCPSRSWRLSPSRPGSDVPFA